MKHTEAIVGNVLTILVDGPLEQDSAPELLAVVEAALEQGRDRFVIDVARVPHADSGGLEVLVRIASKVFRSGGRLGLFGATETLAETLRVTRLDQRLASFPTREAALARVRAGD